MTLGPLVESPKLELVFGHEKWRGFHEQLIRLLGF